MCAFCLLCEKSTIPTICAQCNSLGVAVVLLTEQFTLFINYNYCIVKNWLVMEFRSLQMNLVKSETGESKFRQNKASCYFDN